MNASAAEIAQTTKQRLAELAFIHKATWRLKHDAVPEVARCLFDKWEQLFGADERLKRCFAKFKDALRQWEPEQADIGRYFNKMCVVYAVAILEDFLPKAYNSLFRPECFHRSLTSQLKQIKDKTNDSLAKEQVTKYAMFLARVRNVIVHNDGKPDAEFRDGRGGKGPPLRDLWDETICSCDEFEGRSKGQVWLNIDKVIMPYLAHAIDFVGTVVDVLTKYPRS